MYGVRKDQRHEGEQCCKQQQQNTCQVGGTNRVCLSLSATEIPNLFLSFAIHNQKFIYLFIMLGSLLQCLSVCLSVLVSEHCRSWTKKDRLEIEPKSTMLTWNNILVCLVKVK